MLHIGHTTQYGEHTLRCSRIAESPRCHAALWCFAFQLCSQILGQVGQSSAQQGFHDDGRDMAFLQFLIQVTGIHITVVYLVGIVPVQIVQLYLHKVPVVLLIHGQYLVEYLLKTMEREAKMTDASRLALFHQIVHHTVIHIATVKLVHAATDGVQQIVVDIVHLQVLQRVLIHLDTRLPTLCRGVEVRQFGSH